MALILMGMALAGCNIGVRSDAAKGVEAFLTAVRTGNRPAFEAVIDRDKLRADLRGQLIELGREQGLEVEGGASDFALDRMISPEAFRPLQAELGPVRPKALAATIKVVNRHRVCLLDAPDSERCVLTFAKEKAAWKLVGMRARDPKLAVALSD
ncbi:MAG: hypothetical protein ABW360_12715 [Phenylobacterium sp.]